MTPQEIIARNLRAEQNGEWVNSYESQAQGILTSLEIRGYRLVHTGHGATHWEGCWRYHLSCAVALIERMQ